MNSVSQKSVARKLKNGLVFGLGLAVTVGFAPVTTLASFQHPAKQTCRFNGQSQGTDLMRVSEDERTIIARGGNRTGGGGGGTGQRGGDNSESEVKYGPGDGTGTRERPGDGTGYGARKGAGTGDRDGAGSKRKGRGNRTN